MHCTCCTDERWRYAVVDRTENNLQFFKEQQSLHAADAKTVDTVNIDILIVLSVKPVSIDSWNCYVLCIMMLLICV